MHKFIGRIVMTIIPCLTVHAMEERGEGRSPIKPPPAIRIPPHPQTFGPQPGDPPPPPGGHGNQSQDYFALTPQPPALPQTPHGRDGGG